VPYIIRTLGARRVAAVGGFPSLPRLADAAAQPGCATSPTIQTTEDLYATSSSRLQTMAMRSFEQRAAAANSCL